MKTEFNVGDFVWATFKVNEINVSSSGDIFYNLTEVSDHRKGIRLINKIEEELVPANFKEEYDVESCAHKIKCYRIVDAEEKKGEWIDYERSDGVDFIKCSNCEEYIVRNAEDLSDYRIVANFKPNYCPFCGAKMKDEE